MRKPIFYYLAGVLTAIAIFAAIWGFGLIILERVFDFGGGSSNYNVITTSLSSDEKYIVTVYSSMGGGAAGWCSIRVTVNPASEPFSIKREKNEEKYIVFNGNCSIEVDAKWNGERTLFINYRNLIKDSGISIYKKPINWDSKVKIRYIEE